MLRQGPGGRPWADSPKHTFVPPCCDKGPGGRPWADGPMTPVFRLVATKALAADRERRWARLEVNHVAGTAKLPNKGVDPSYETCCGRDHPAADPVTRTVCRNKAEQTTTPERQPHHDTPHLVATRRNRRPPPSDSPITTRPTLSQQGGTDDPRRAAARPRPPQPQPDRLLRQRVDDPVLVEEVVQPVNQIVGR